MCFKFFQRIFSSGRNDDKNTKNSKSSTHDLSNYSNANSSNASFGLMTKSGTFESDRNGQAAQSQSIQKRASAIVLAMMVIIACITTFVFNIAFYGEICSFSFEEYEQIVVTLHDIHFCETSTPDWANACPSSLNTTNNLEDRYMCADMRNQVAVTNVFMFTTYYLYIAVVALYSFVVLVSLLRSFCFGERLTCCTLEQDLFDPSSSSFSCTLCCFVSLRRCCRCINKYFGKFSSLLTGIMTFVLCLVPLFSVLMSIPAFLTISLSVSRLCRSAKSGMFVRPLINQSNFSFGIASHMVIVGAVLCCVTTLVLLVVLIKARKQVVALTVVGRGDDDHDRDDEDYDGKNHLEREFSEQRHDDKKDAVV